MATPQRSIEREMDYQRGGLHLIYTLTPLWQPQLMEMVSGCWQMQRIQGRCLPLWVCSPVCLTQLAVGLITHHYCSRL